MMISLTGGTELRAFSTDGSVSAAFRVGITTETRVSS
jgi:hypothetical protein